MKKYNIWAAALLFVALGVGGALGGNNALAQRATVAVAGFVWPGTEQAGDDQGALIAKLFTQELIGQAQVEVVERQALQKIIAEQRLAMAGITSGPGDGLATLAGVDYIISGTILPAQPWSTLTGRIIARQTGAIVAMAEISYQNRDQFPAVAKGLAVMLGHYFSPNGALIPKENVPVALTTSASPGSTSTFRRGGQGIGTWSYTLNNDGDDVYADLSLDLTERDLTGKRLLVSWQARNSLPVYVRFYSFVPGYSAEDDDDSLVMVETEVALDAVASEYVADYRAMTVPTWWRAEHHNQQVNFNPHDVRFIEFGAIEGEVGDPSRSDKIVILRIQCQHLD